MFNGSHVPAHLTLLVAAVIAAGITVVPLQAAAQTPSEGCPQYQCSASRVGATPSNLSSSNVTDLAKSWSFRTDDRIYAAPSSADGMVYVGSEDQHVYAVDQETGEQVWAFLTDGGIWSTPAVAGDVVYFGSSDDHVYAVDATTGTLQWEFETGGDISSSVAVADGVVYAPSNDTHLYALDATTGAELWRFQAGQGLPAHGEGDPAADHRISSAPAVADGTVYVGSNNGHLYAIDAATGQMKWSFQTDAWVWGGGPTVSDGVVVVRSNGSDGALYAIDAATGEEVWSVAGDGFSTPVVAGDVVISSSYSTITAHSLLDGTEQWSYQAPGYMFVSPLITNDLVLAVNSGFDQAAIVGPSNLGDGSLIALDLSSGEVVHEVYYPIVAHAYSSPIAVGDQVFFGTGADVLHSLSLPGGAPQQEIVADPDDPLLPYANRDVLANSVDPGSPAVLRQPGDGVLKTIGSDDPQGTNADYKHFHGLTDDDVTADGREILLDVRGPGVLTDMYMYFGIGGSPVSPLGPRANPPTDFGLVAPTLAMYIDNNPEPVFDMNGFEFYTGGAGFPFQFPLVGEHSAAFSSHVPVPFTERLLIVRDPAETDSGFWFDFFYQKFPDARGVESFDPERDREEYEALLERWTVDPPTPDPATANVASAEALAPGESVTLLDQDGPGQVSLINLPYVNETPPVETTPSSDPDNDPRAAEPLKGVRIQARWDGQPDLAIDAPIGDFFGTGFGQAQDYDTLVNGMETAVDAAPQQWPHAQELSSVSEGGGVSMYTTWPMPFAEHAEITLTNTLSDTTVDVAFEVVVDPENVYRDDAGRLFRDEEEVGYFHAQEFYNFSPSYDSPKPDKLNNDHFVELDGRGNYVGHVFNMRTHNFVTGGPNIPTYMEGDCMFWIDHAPDYKPDITSTGHEECHDTGAYFQGDEHNATAGTTNRELGGDTIFLNFFDETSIFHYFVGDAIGFQDYFMASIEHGAENSFNGAEQAGVVFYYLEGSSAGDPSPPEPDSEPSPSTTPAAPTPTTGAGSPAALLGAVMMLLGAMAIRRRRSTATAWASHVHDTGTRS